MEEYEYTEHWMQRLVDRLDRLIEIGERVEGQVRLPSEDESKTVADVLMNDTCIPSDAVGAEPPKKWRILEPGERVHDGDWLCEKLLPYANDPLNGPGWIDAKICVGSTVVPSDKCVFARPVADEPPKKWRILDFGEVVQEGDWMNAMGNSQEDGPPDGGWLPAASFYFGKEASAAFRLYFARPVADEPAKKPEHPAEPMLSMEGYRPVNDSDIGRMVEVQNSTARAWRECTLLAIDWDRRDGFLCRHSDPGVTLRWCFARIKIDEPPKPAEPEYREPVLPADAGKWAEFSISGNDWTEGKLRGYAGGFWQSVFGESVDRKWWDHCRIKKDA